MNEQFFVEFNIEKCFDLAEEIFLKSSGINKEGDKFERMRQSAFALRDELGDGIDIKGLHSHYDSFSLGGEWLTVFRREDVIDSNPLAAIKCTAFAQIDPASVEGVYAYAVSAGDYHLEARPIMDQLFADMWGTAFTEAARQMVIEDLLTETTGDGATGKMSLSDNFGPGFYGMDSGEMLKLPALVDFDALGLEVLESSVISPMKSCAGILFKVNDRYKQLNLACEHCYGNRRSCNLCAVLSK